MVSTNFEFTTNLNVFLENLCKAIPNHTENSNITEEEIYNIAMNLRNNKKIPFYPKSIGPFKAYSIDIHYCIKVLETIDFLNQVAHQSIENKTFYVDSFIGKNLDINQILCKKELLRFCTMELENEFQFESRIFDTDFDFMEEENCLFTHLGCLDRKLDVEVDFGQIGIDCFKKLIELEPKENMRKHGFEKRALLRLGEIMLNHYDNLFPYNLRVASLRETYEKDREMIKGKLVSIVGIFEDDYSIASDDLVYEFRDSIIFDTNHRISVLLARNGKFPYGKFELLEKECLLLGFIESLSEEVALRVAGVINTDSRSLSAPKSAAIQKIPTSQKSEVPEIIVGESNGTETHV